MATHIHGAPVLDRLAMLAMRGILALQRKLGHGSESRADYDALLEKVPAAEYVSYEEGELGGVPGWWCRPRDAMREAALLHLHGGAYRLGSARANRHFAGQVAARAECSSFVVDYRLAPEHPFPAAFDDAWGAYKGLAHLASAVAIVGESAGGGLALALLAHAAAAARGGSALRPVGAAVMSPWVDLALTGASMRTRASADPLLTREMLEGSARSYLDGSSPRDPRASPLYGDFAGLPPVRIDVGDDEVLLDDARRFAEAVERSGGEADLHVWSGMPHVFQTNVSRLRTAREALDGVGDHLRRSLSAIPQRG